MKIKKNELIRLIESYLLEQEDSDQPAASSGNEYKIYFAARSFIGDLSASVADYLDEYDAGHAWIMVKKPGEEIISYSGKSGAAFETFNLVTAIELVLSTMLTLDDTVSVARDRDINRDVAYMSDKIQDLIYDGQLTNEEGERVQTIIKRLTIGRNADQDELMARMQSLKDQGFVTIEEYKNILKDQNWGPLRKLKNWENDTFEIATSPGNYVIEVMPRAGESQEDVKRAIEKIESAFANYNEDVPYDPIPGSNDNVPSDARNSNSFAYTLLRHILGTDKNVEDRINYKDIGMQLPGWGKFVNGLRP